MFERDDGNEKDIDIATRLIGLDLKININILYRSTFEEEAIENMFIANQKSKSKFQIILSDFMLIIGYLTSLSYIIIAFYNNLFIISFSTFFFICITLMLFSYISKNQKIKYIIDHLQIFFLSANMNVKILIICFYFNTETNDNSDELLRIIIYDFVATNLLILVKVDGTLFVHLFYFLMNLFSIFVCIIKSKNDHFYYLESYTSLAFSLCFFGFRKAWDYKLRLTYGEKLKFEYLFLYTNDFIKGLNGYHLNFRKDYSFYYEKNFWKFLEEHINIEARKIDFKTFNEKFCFGKKATLAPQNTSCINFDVRKNNNNLSNKQNIEYGDDFFKNNSIYADNPVTVFLSQFKKYNIKNIDDYNETNFLQINKKITLEEYKIKINGENINLPQVSKNESELNHWREKLNDPIYNQLFNNYDLNNSSLKLISNINNDCCLKSEKNMNGKIMNNSNFSYNEISNNGYVNINLLDQIKYISLNYLNEISKTYLGIYSLHVSKKKKHSSIFFEDIKFIEKDDANINPHKKNKVKFFDIYFRKVSFGSDNILNNIIFYEVTDLINSKIELYEENKMKNKIMTKIAHEFKTPLISIISLTNSLKGSGSLSTLSAPANMQLQKTCDLIQNLSRFIIFLTSDIIHYSNSKNMIDLNFNIQDIDFNEIIEFCYDILNSLLYCNQAKFQKIQTELKYDKNIDKISLKSDDVRIKQIIINFISNSVKFTNQGKIVLECSLRNDIECIQMGVIDTGLGIKDEAKAKLFTDFINIEDENNNYRNNLNIALGSGLGLSICKNMAEKLKMKIKFESNYGYGSTFMLLIPYDKSTLDSALLKNCVNTLSDNIIRQNEIIYKSSRNIRKNDSSLMIVCF